MIETHEVLAALEQACEEHDGWLRRLDCWVEYSGRKSRLVWTREREHPMIGTGAPAREVAQVLAHGLTHHERWHEQMEARGIASFADIEFYEAQRIADSFETIYETDSERARAVAALRRAKAAGLVAYDPRHGVWQITAEGDALLREVA